MAALSNWYSNQYGVWRRSSRLPMPGFLANTNALGAQSQPTTATSATDKSKNETLFGPALGAVQPAPDWTNIKASTKDLSDELTPEIVRSWIAKSKDPSQPTTTLQALVNLKRPTLRLSPLTDDPAHHAIEFEYDADAPKCSVQVHVFSPAAPTSPVLVYEHIIEGGFAKSLKLEDDAVLELAKYEFAGTGSDPSSTGDKSADTTAPSNVTTVPQAESSEAVASAHAATGAAGNRKRFSAFPFRKRQSRLPTAGNPVTAGPALQVVDVDAAAPSDGLTKKDEDGVRVTIKLEALDDEEHSLPSVNTQTTYLHIVRMGAKSENTDEDDNRPWIVKVVKREATIGYHTFHLHEIYGLTSASSNASAPPAPAYPPTSSPTQALDNSYDFAGQECVLCLSSPREVVLLPCRHLVACKECAMNMVEFGAGGTLHHAAEPEPAPPVAEPTQEQASTTDNATAAAPADTPAAPAPVVPVAPRRKRKAKGWFCPVCRQPYTSLLRITTSPPDLKPVRDSEDGGDPLSVASAPPAEQDITAAAAERPSFLRSLSRAFTPSTAGTPQPGTAPAEVPGHVV